jgi:uncharacterized membrane protein (UPF0127 family)
MRRFFIAIAAAGVGMVTLTGCGERASTMDDITSTDLTLPNGTKLVCETMRLQIDLTRGMMFRDPLPPNRGMLFVYPKDERHTQWMYQMKFPVDAIWMNADHEVLEIVANMPPCTSKAAHECTWYGGKSVSRYVLEVNGGFAAKNGVKVGDKIDF